MRRMYQVVIVVLSLGLTASAFASVMHCAEQLPTALRTGEPRPGNAAPSPAEPESSECTVYENAVVSGPVSVSVGGDKIIAVAPPAAWPASDAIAGSYALRPAASAIDFSPYVSNASSSLVLRI